MNSSARLMAAQLAMLAMSEATAGEKPMMAMDAQMGDFIYRKGPQPRYGRPRNDPERIAAAEAKRARKNAKRAQPSATEGRS